jgi:hypothetical protein
VLLWFPMMLSGGGPRPEVLGSALRRVGDLTPLHPLGSRAGVPGWATASTGRAFALVAILAVCAMCAAMALRHRD